MVGRTTYKIMRLFSVDILKRLLCRLLDKVRSEPACDRKCDIRQQANHITRQSQTSSISTTQIVQRKNKEKKERNVHILRRNFLKCKLRHDRPHFATRRTQPVTRRSIPRREAFAREQKCCRVGPEVLEEAREDEQE